MKFSGIVTGIIRLVYFFQIDMFADVTWHAPGTMSWTLVEPGVYLIAATLPSLRPLVRYFFKDVKLDTLYNNLLDRCSRAFSTHKHSKGSMTNIGLNSTSTHVATITTGNGAPSAGFVRLEDLQPQGQKVAHQEWV